ncbi:MAG: hypothetical protein K6G18_12155 [Treponema sp.]|nr:hypothetical protein [Treponema sp.]
MNNKKSTSFASFICAAYLVTVVVFIASVGMDISKGKADAERRFRKLTSATSQSLKENVVRSESFYNAFLKALGNVSDMAGIQISDQHGLVISYPNDLGEDGESLPGVIVEPYRKRTKLNDKNGQEVTLTAAIYQLNPSDLYNKLRLTFLAVLAETLVCMLYLIYMSLYGKAEATELDTAAELDEGDGEEVSNSTNGYGAQASPPREVAAAPVQMAQSVATMMAQDEEVDGYENEGFRNYELTQEEYDGLLSDDIEVGTDDEYEDDDGDDLDDDLDIEELDEENATGDTIVAQESAANAEDDDRLFNDIDDEDLLGDDSDEPSFLPPDDSGDDDRMGDDPDEPSFLPSDDSGGDDLIGDDPDEPSFLPPDDSGDDDDTIEDIEEKKTAADTERTFQADPPADSDDDLLQGIDDEDDTDDLLDDADTDAADASTPEAVTERAPAPEAPASEEDDTLLDEDESTLDMDFPAEEESEPTSEEATVLEPSDGRVSDSEDDLLLDENESTPEMDVPSVEDDASASEGATALDEEEDVPLREIPAIDDSILDDTDDLKADGDEDDEDEDADKDDGDADEQLLDKTEEDDEDADLLSEETPDATKAAVEPASEVEQPSNSVPAPMAPAPAATEATSTPAEPAPTTVEEPTIAAEEAVQEAMEPTAPVEAAASEKEFPSASEPELDAAVEEDDDILFDEEVPDATEAAVEPASEVEQPSNFAPAPIEPSPDTATEESTTETEEPAPAPAESAPVPAAEPEPAPTQEEAPAPKAAAPAPAQEAAPAQEQPVPLPTPAVPAGPTGLYSDRTGFGWESYMLPRVDNEILRCTKSNQDISVVSVRIDGIDWTKDEGKAVCNSVKGLINSPDLIFEKGDDAFTAALPDTNVNEAITLAEELYNSIDEILAQYGSDAALGIGISSRSLRMISGERLANEAEVALNHAMEDESSPIVAFKVDPQKYRKFLAAQAEQESEEAQGTTR